MRTSLILIIFAALCIDLNAQCDTLRHNVSWFDGWISCEETASPNAVRGPGHWIEYDLGQMYTLYEMRIWNTNAPEYLDYGMQNIHVDISADGVTWTEVGQYAVPQAPGDSRYEGIELMSFDSLNAQYVLITAIDNYGGNCFGLSEIRIRAREACQGGGIRWIAGNGNWDIPANWCSNRIPNETDEVTIPSGVIVTIPEGFKGTVKRLNVDPSAELKMMGDLDVLKED